MEMANVRSGFDAPKIRKLYLQAAKQQWAADEALDFSSGVAIDPELRAVWGELATVFYTLEKMGLGVLTNMHARAARKFASEDTLLYLTMQCADEGRHVYAIEKYLALLGRPPEVDPKLHILGQVASMGPYRVENWLFSTLFSENFASSFLRRAKAADIDPVGAEMCRRLLIDESRHIHFLHIVLPDVLPSLSTLGRGYVKLSQYFIMKFTERVTRALAESGKKVGIDRRDLLEEVFENVEKAYDAFGVGREFLYFPRLSS